MQCKENNTTFNWQPCLVLRESDITVAHLGTLSCNLRLPDSPSATTVAGGLVGLMAAPEDTPPATPPATPPPPPLGLSDGPRSK